MREKTIVEAVGSLVPRDKAMDEITFPEKDENGIEEMRGPDGWKTAGSSATPHP